MDSTRTRYAMTLIGSAILLGLGVMHALRGSTFIYDVLISLAGVLLFTRLYAFAHQDTTSYGVLLTWLILHCLGFYDKVIWIVPWDKWMHLIGGFAIALVLDRMFVKERWTYWTRAAVLIFMALGVGAFHEIVEWLGYGYLGAGDGFLFYGTGDFGEWQNSITDMACNLVGAAIVAFGKKS